MVPERDGTHGAKVGRRPTELRHGILAYREIKEAESFTQIRVIRLDVVCNFRRKLGRLKQRPILDVMPVFGQVSNAVESPFV